MTAKTTTTTTHLPAGYDDSKSRWYIPLELRDYYEPVPAAVRRAAFRSVLFEFWGQGDLSAGAVGFARHVLSQSGEADKIRKKHGSDKKHAEAIVRRRVKQIAEDMGREDEDWWVHYSRAMPATQKRYDKAQAWENGGRQLWEAQHTCEVCGTVSHQVNANAPVNLRFTGSSSGGVHVLSCPRCRHLLPDVAADDQVNGRPRREVVAAWVAKNG